MASERLTDERLAFIATNKFWCGSPEFVGAARELLIARRALQNIDYDTDSFCEHAERELIAEGVLEENS